MRKPDEDTLVSASVEVDSFHVANLEVDALFPIAGRELAAGFGAYKYNFASAAPATHPRLL